MSKHDYHYKCKCEVCVSFEKDLAKKIKTEENVSVTKDIMLNLKKK